MWSKKKKIEVDLVNVETITKWPSKIQLLLHVTVHKPDEIAARNQGPIEANLSQLKPVNADWIQSSSFQDYCVE